MIVPPPYCICFECGHVYRTEADLMAAYNRAMDELEAEIGGGPVWVRKTTGAEIPFCPACAHDF